MAHARLFTDTREIKMQTKNESFSIAELCEGYVNNAMGEEGGVTSMNGKLNIRPRYQRLYIRENDNVWRENLINSIICGFPINRLYFGAFAEGSELRYEVLDGQQRLMTICEFLKGNFPVMVNNEPIYGNNLPEDIARIIRKYEVDVTICTGDEDARIKWFKRINQPNSILTEQELRNATYRGEWLDYLKKFFCATSANSRKQVTDKEDKYYAGRYSRNRAVERCDILETALDWISYYELPDMRDGDKGERIERYMHIHQNDEPNDNVINHYKKVIDWINDTFLNFSEKVDINKIQSLAGVEWGRLYTLYGNVARTDEETRYISDRVREMLVVQTSFGKPAGLYEWVVRGEREGDRGMITPRDFSEENKKKQYALQGGICPISGEKLALCDMEAHHIIPWRNCGTNDIENLALLSPESHKRIHVEGIYTPTELKAKVEELKRRVYEEKLSKNS